MFSLSSLIISKEITPYLNSVPAPSSVSISIRRGVKFVVIIDGRIPHSILIEMLTDDGAGTEFR